MVAKKTVTLVDEKGEVAGLAVAGAASAEPTVTQVEIDEMKAVEQSIVEYLKAQPMRDVYVPRGLFGGPLAVVYNGLRFDFDEGQSHSMSEPIAQLVEIRRDAAELTRPVR